MASVLSPGLSLQAPATGSYRRGPRLHRVGAWGRRHSPLSSNLPPPGLPFMLSRFPRSTVKVRLASAHFTTQVRTGRQGQTHPRLPRSPLPKSPQASAVPSADAPHKPSPTRSVEKKDALPWLRKHAPFNAVRPFPPLQETEFYEIINSYEINFPARSL